MTRFDFTRKKFLGLSGKGQHQWIIRWLSRIYQEFLTGRLTGRQQTEFYTDYTRILSWMELAPKPAPEAGTTRSWIEFISDAIHGHRIAAGMSVKDPDLLPQAWTRDRQPSAMESRTLDYHMALDGLRSLFNIGSIFRTCDAAGFTSLILGNIPDGGHPGIRKTAMGTSDWMPHTATDDLAGELLIRRETGYAVIGIETVGTATPYHEFQWPDRGIVVVGNEEYGIASHVLAVCTDLVRIPMVGRKNSINVASAASVVAFHVAGALRNR